jgi:hypothetical protein
VGQYSPETAARTTIANRQQLDPWFDTEPYRVQFVAPDQMDQSRLTTTLDILEGLLFRNTVTQLWVDLQCRLAKEKTT